MSHLPRNLSYAPAGRGVILPENLRTQNAARGVETMYSRVSKHFADRADRLIRGQLDHLVQDHVYPLPMHLAANRIVLRNPDEARAVYGLLRQEMLDRGVTRLSPVVSAIDIPRKGRFRVWVDWHKEGGESVDGQGSSAIYCCRDTPAGLRIEMIAYINLSMPELNPRFAALALSA